MFTYGDTATVEVDGERITGKVYHVRENGWPCVQTFGGRQASGPEFNYHLADGEIRNYYGHGGQLRRLAIEYLTKDGNLGVPCSRYGRNSEECAVVAWRVAWIVARETVGVVTTSDLDYAMSMVVNDSDAVRELIREYGHGHYDTNRRERSV